MKPIQIIALVVALLSTGMAPAASIAQTDDLKPLSILFLGDNGHHKPLDRFRDLYPVMAKRGIHLHYTDDVNALNAATLAEHDGIMIYANIGVMTKKQEAALLDYVEGGGAFIPIHCASYCFLNSTKYIALVGAQFKSHRTGVFRVNPKVGDHPIIKDLPDLESWDETYVHAKHNDKDRVVLQTRTEGGDEEPWTWIRTQGKGRVFYTAWGHDQRTWSQLGFHDLIERGVRWAARQPVKNVKREFPSVGTVKAKIPNYKPGAQWGKQGEPFGEMAKPISPEDSMKRMVTPPGFRVELFAAEPMIGPVLAMAWDERGRLWVNESVDYPNSIQAEGKGNDRIKILEDTDGDGKADKVTVFADKLSIPTSIAHAAGGVIVHQAPHTLFLKDTTGDGKADLRKVLFTGWSTGDTHAGPSNLRYGHDNWYYGMVGYAGFNGTIAGKKQSFRTGFYRFKLDPKSAEVVAFEFLRNNNNNTWGVGFNEEGVLFGSTANRNPSVYMPIANRYYEAVRGWSSSTLGPIADTFKFMPISDNVRQVDVHGGYTAAAGAALYTARRYPKQYWNRTKFICGPTGKLIGVFEVEPNGADFKSRNLWNLVASTDEWTGPIVAEVGPDGNVWFIDFYNYIIQHNPTPVGFKNGRGNAYETDARDKKHARIYRVVYGDPTKDEIKSLANASPKQLVAALGNSNMLWRKHAQRLLVERGVFDVAPQLIQTMRHPTSDELGLGVASIHAMWTLKGLGVFDQITDHLLAAGMSATEVLRDRQSPAAARKAAIETAPRIAESAAVFLDARLLEDANAHVRLSTLLALADTELPLDFQTRAGVAIFDMLKRPENANDRWITDAATAAAARHDAGFLRAVLAATKRSKPTVKPLAHDTTPRTEPKNLVFNGNFETIHNNQPQHWKPVTYGGQATHEVSDAGRSGKCVKITSTAGSDASWTFNLDVKPRTRYRVSAWVKTDKLVKGGSLGALINLHQLQKQGKTQAIVGTRDWTNITSEFETGNHTALGVNMLFGGWGQAKGTAYWDDVQIIELGPATGQIAMSNDSLPGKLGQVVSIVTRHYAERAPIDTIVPTLASLKSADEKLASFMLDGIARGWPKGKAPALTDVDRAELAALMKALPQGQRDKLLAIADKWGKRDIFSGDIAAVVESMRGKVTNAQLADDQRVDSASRLIRLDDSNATAALIVQQINPQASQALVVGVIHALGDSRNDASSAALIEIWSKLTPSARRAGLAVLMRRPSWTTAMLAAVEKGAIHKADLSASDWQVLSLHKDKTIAARASKLVANRDDADRQKVFARMLPHLESKGDVKVGETLFTKLCAQCHTHNGKGGKIGPELTGIGARPPREILAEIVDPNRSLESNFRLWSIETNDFEQYAGRLDGETKTTVEILTLDGKRHVIQRKDIDTMQASSKSIMPPGLIDHLKPKETASLLEFLKSGKH